MGELFQTNLGIARKQMVDNGVKLHQARVFTQIALVFRLAQKRPVLVAVTNELNLFGLFLSNECC